MKISNMKIQISNSNMKISYNKRVFSIQKFRFHIYIPGM